MTPTGQQSNMSTVLKNKGGVIQPLTLQKHPGSQTPGNFNYTQQLNGGGAINNSASYTPVGRLTVIEKAHSNGNSLPFQRAHTNATPHIMTYQSLTNELE